MTTSYTYDGCFPFFSLHFIYQGEGLASSGDAILIIAGTNFALSFQSTADSSNGDDHTT
jgi:hypothetical protein